MIRCVDLVLEDLLYVCKRMTQDEIEQLEAIDGDPFDYRRVALMFAAFGGVKFTLIDDNNLPICCGGYYELVPGTWESWMACTPDTWTKHWRSATKHPRRLMSMLFKHGARRLQTRVLASRLLARKWYEDGLRLEFEGVMRGFAANGGDVAMYVKMKES